MNIKIIKYQTGMTLLEVLISLIILAIGLIGLAQLSGNVIRSSNTDSDMSVSMAAVTNQMVPLYVAAANSRTAFETPFNSLVTGMDITANNGMNFKMQIAEAVDANGTALIGGPAIAAWISPIRVGIRISFEGLTDVSGRSKNDAGFNTTRTIHIPFTFQI